MFLLRVGLLTYKYGVDSFGNALPLPAHYGEVVHSSEVASHSDLKKPFCGKVESFLSQ